MSPAHAFSWIRSDGGWPSAEAGRMSADRGPPRGTRGPSEHSQRGEDRSTSPELQVCALHEDEREPLGPAAFTTHALMDGPTATAAREASSARPGSAVKLRQGQD